jgi:hypothetical protein
MAFVKVRLSTGEIAKIDEERWTIEDELESSDLIALRELELNLTFGELWKPPAPPGEFAEYDPDPPILQRAKDLIRQRGGEIIEQDLPPESILSDGEVF